MSQLLWRAGAVNIRFLGLQKINFRILVANTLIAIVFKILDFGKESRVGNRKSSVSLKFSFGLRAEKLLPTALRSQSQKFSFLRSGSGPAWFPCYNYEGRRWFKIRRSHWRSTLMRILLWCICKGLDTGSRGYIENIWGLRC